MDVFVGNITEKTNEIVLERLFQKFCKSAHVRFIKRQTSGARIRYACVEIDPDKQAKRAIKMLNNSVFDGQLIMLRPFNHRASFNERRATGSKNRKWAGSDKRRGERRGYIAEKFNDGVQLVEMQLLEGSQGAHPAKDKTTQPPVRRASQVRR